MNKEMLNKVLSDKDKLQGLLNSTNVTEAREYLKNEGLDCTEADVEKILTGIVEIAKKANAEKMSVDDMDSVAGGADFTEIANQFGTSMLGLFSLQNSLKVQMVGTVLNSVVDLGEAIYDLF